jgi:hypothetical protein|tara:strand:+ start:83 stop:967 length:885 start_codon:yes stop_codon:yes gene_type:complete
MADTNGQVDIRGLDIKRIVRGFADEKSMFDTLVENVKASARKIRWFQKTAGFLDSNTTTGITTSRIENHPEGARPVVVGQTWTRNETYVRKRMVESEWVTIEDISDNDVRMWATLARDLVRAVRNQKDKRIYNVITEDQTPSTINSGAATGNGWDDTSNGNPILDILAGQQAIRSNSYNPSMCVIVMNSIEHKHLMNYLITVKGSSWTGYSSEKIREIAVTNILGNDVIVSENAVTDSVAMWIPSASAQYHSFINLDSGELEDKGVARKIRVWEEGECTLSDPKSVYLITDTIT